MTIYGVIVNSELTRDDMAMMIAGALKDRSIEEVEAWLYRLFASRHETQARWDAMLRNFHEAEMRRFDPMI